MDILIDGETESSVHIRLVQIGYRPTANKGVVLSALVFQNFAFFPSCALPSCMLLCPGSRANNWEHEKQWSENAVKEPSGNFAQPEKLAPKPQAKNADS